jgi:hypothetical protein
MGISTLKKMKTPNKVQLVSLIEEHYSKVKTGWSSQSLLNFDPISTAQMCCDRPKIVAISAIATQI